MVLAVVGAVALFTIVGFFVVPPIVKRQLETRLSRQLHRPVSIGRLRTNPFELSETIDSVQVRDLDGGPLLSWEHLYINFELWSTIFRRQLVFSDISIEKPFLRARIRPSGELGFSDIIDSLNAPSAPSPKNDLPSRPPVVWINSLHVGGARIDVVDSARTAAGFTTTIGPFRIEVQNFATLRDNSGRYAFSGSTESGEQFSWRGTFSVDPLRSAGEFAILNVRLGKYRPFYERTIGWDFAGGTTSLTSGYELDLSPKPRRVMRLVNAALHVDSAALMEHGTKDVVVRVPVLSLTGTQVDYLKSTMTIASIATSGGTVDARRSRDSTVNIVRMIEPLLAEPPEGAKRAERWRYTIGRFEADKYTVIVDDSTTARPAKLSLSDVTLRVDSIRDDSDAVSPARTSFTWGGGGSATADGRLTILRSKGQLAVTLQKVALGPLDPYLDNAGKFLVMRGTASADVRTTFDLLDPKRTDATLDGNMRFENVATVDQVNKSPFVSWRSLSLAGISISQREKKVVVRNVVLDAPVVALTIFPDRTTSLARIFPSDSAHRVVVDTSSLEPEPASRADSTAPDTLAAGETADSAASKDSVGAPAVIAAGHDSTTPATHANARSAPRGRPGTTTIGGIRIINGTVRITDKSIQPTATFALTKITGTTGSISSTQLNRGALDMTAAVDDVAPVKLSGTFNPLNSNEESRVRIQSEGIQMVTFSPYVGRYFGYGVAKGTMRLDLKYNVRARKFDSENVITLDQFDFDDKVESPEAIHVPIRLALALLKDQNGIAVIDVPASGNIDDPHFKLIRVIMRAIVNVLKKVVVAPFKLLGGLFGGGSKTDLSKVDFTAGTDTLGADQKKSLDALTKALQERPALKLEIQGAVDTLADVKALKTKQLDQELRAEKASSKQGKAPEVVSADSTKLSAAERPALLWAAYTKAFPSDSVVLAHKKKEKNPPLDADEMQQRLMEQATLPEGELHALSSGRAKACQDYLVGKGIDPTRILAAPESDGRAGTAGARALFKLQ